MKLEALMSLVSNLQIALQHPNNVGRSAAIARLLIEDALTMMERAGYVANAEACRVARP